jgi:hypothetical protein
MVSQVSPRQKDGQPWGCLWCLTSNAGFTKRKDSSEATIADLAATLEQRGISLAAAEAASREEPMLRGTIMAFPPH